MTRDDFYDWRRKELKIDFLSDIRVVRKYYSEKMNVSQADIEMIWKLNSLGKFIKNDYHITAGVFVWETQRFHRLMQEGWIEVDRERKPSEGQNYKIFQVTKKARMMIYDTYKILCGEKPIPMDKRVNPIMKRETYTDKVYATAIERFNESMASRKK